MSRERSVSIMASRASAYVNEKKPSLLIPFTGNFPLIELYQLQEYNKAVESTDILEELPEEFQVAVVKGNEIGLLESYFKEYLSEIGISENDFIKKSNSDKSTILIKWMEKERIPMSKLNIG